MTVGMFQGILGELEVWSVRGAQGTLAAVWPLSHCSPTEPHQEARQEILGGLTASPNGGRGATPVKGHGGEAEAGRQTLSVSLVPVMREPALPLVLCKTLIS